MDNNRLQQLVNDKLDFFNVDKGEKISTPNIEMNPELMEQILDLYNEDDGFNVEKMRKFSIDEILHYLQTTHKYYLTKKLPEIEQSIIHILDKNNDSPKLLASVVCFFNAYKNKLIDHIRSEEQELFPYIKKLIALSKKEKAPASLPKIPENFSILTFINSHDPIEDELKEVRQIIQLNADAKLIPLPYKIFLNQVEIFEIELRKHAIIEDYVLIPMAIELEKKFN